MNLAIIGTGKRSTAYTQICMARRNKDVQIVALCDVDREKVSAYRETFFTQKLPDLYYDYQEVLRREDVDAVVITTNDTTHREIAIDALRAGKHLLLEKPIATTLEDSLAIYEESIQHNCVVILGFCLRDLPLYRKTRELIQGGRIGQLVSVEAKEQLGHLHAGSFFRRWHRWEKNNGGFLNAKCSHDLDMLNWLIGEKPLFVSSFGSRSFFNPIAGAAAVCRECSKAQDCIYCYDEKDYGKFYPVDDSCVFTVEKDIVDHQTVSIAYDKGITAVFTVSMLANAANRTMVLFGTKATLEVENVGGGCKETYTFPDVGQMHGGADPHLFERFVQAVQNHTGENNAWDGAMSTALALAAQVSMKEYRTIDFQNWIGGK